MGATPYKYHFLRYNQYGVLRPSWPVRLVLVFLCRHLLFLLAFGAMSFKGKGGSEMQHLLPLLDQAFIVTDLPTLAIFYAMGARRPGASDIIRWVWRHGRHLMLTSVGLFLAITALRHGMNATPPAPVEWAMIAVNVIIAVYVLRSEYLRDLFTEFPQPLKSEKASGAG